MIWIFLTVATPVAAWGMWLLFCRSIAKMHGIDALKAAPPIAKAFPVNAWFSSPRHVGPWLMKAMDHLAPSQPSIVPRPDDGTLSPVEASMPSRAIAPFARHTDQQ